MYFFIHTTVLLILTEHFSRQGIHKLIIMVQSIVVHVIVLSLGGRIIRPSISSILSIEVIFASFLWVFEGLVGFCYL